MWDIEAGIDSFSCYYTLTSKKKSNIMEKLRKLPEFYAIMCNYAQDTYAYLSDCFADKGVKVWVSRKNGNPWGLLVVVHPMLVLGSSDRSALYQPQDKSEYKKFARCKMKLRI